MSNPRRIFPGWEIGILLLYAITRLHRLTAFPLFIDEAFHIRWARDVWAMQPLHGAPDGKLLIPIAAALLWPFDNALWAGRAAMVLIGVVGLAAMIGMGRVLFGRRVALLAGVLWVTLPYAFFFERMVMADSLAASLAMIAGALVVRTLLGVGRRWGESQSGRRKGRVADGYIRNAPPLRVYSGQTSVIADWGVAIAAGGAVALTVLAKISMLPYVILPAMGWVLIARRRETLWRVAVMYGACLMVLVPVMAFATMRGGVGFGNAQRFTSAETGSLAGRVTANLYILFDWVPPYVAWPLLVLAVIGLLWAVARRDGRALWVAALMVLPIGVLSLLSTYLVTRYFLPAAAPAMLLIAALFFWSAKHFPGFRLQGLGVVQVLGAGILFAVMIMGVRFQAQYFDDVAQARLPEPDTRDYIRHSTSGFGLVDGTEWLRDEAGERPITVICQEQITCARLSIYLYDAPNLTISVRDVLTSEWVIEEEAAGRVVLLAEDEPSLSEPFEAGTEYSLTLVKAFARPGGTSTFNLYAIHAAP